MFYVSLGLGVLFVIVMTIIGIVKFSRKVISGEIQRNIDEKLRKVGTVLEEAMNNIEGLDENKRRRRFTYDDDKCTDPHYNFLPCNAAYDDN